MARMHVSGITTDSFMVGNRNPVRGTRASTRFSLERSVHNLTISHFSPTILLTPDEELRDIQFVAFILYDLLRHCAQRLFVCVLWQLAMTSDYLFSAFNPHQPIRFVCVP